MTQSDVRPVAAIAIGLIGAVLWAVFLAVPHIRGTASPLDTAEAQSMDIRQSLLGSLQTSEEVVIVAIDDATFAARGEEIKDNRQLLAKVIRSIQQSGARALAMDVLLADPGTPSSDAELAAALSSMPATIAAAASFETGSEGQGSAEASGILWPQQIFRDAAQAGLVNLSTDAGGTPRYAPLLFTLEGTVYPSLVLLAATAVSSEQVAVRSDHLLIGGRRVPLDAGANLPLRYIGPASTVPTLSARPLLSGQMGDQLSGKLVVLGFTASAMGDRFPTPFDDSLPGVEVIATSIGQLLGGPTLRRDTQVRWLDGAHAVTLAGVATGLIVALPLATGAPAAVFLLLVSMVGVLIFFASGLWLSAALPLAAAGPPIAVAGAWRYARERRLAQRSERAVQNLRRFQSPSLARKIQDDPRYLSQPVEQHLIIFFIDLSGFTGLSQRLGADGTQSLLKTFHTLIADVVVAQGGSVFNFMGDGALAVFGLEEDAAVPPADAALEAAFDLTDAIAAQRVSELPDVRLGCRIGLHAGLATLSRLGAENHQQVTVTGDNVNLSSRLMEVAKTEKATVVASHAFSEALQSQPRRPPVRKIEAPIRGRAGTVNVLVW